MGEFEHLLSQVDGFIRKFYKNQIIKGILLFVGVFVATYLFVVTLEFFGRFGSVVRGALLLLFLIINTIISVKFLITPFLRLKSYGKKLNRKQAAEIIGRFFPKVSDRLLNTLQLKDQMVNDSSYGLLKASVEQRSASLGVFKFTDAVDLKENKKHLKWVVPIIFLLFLVGFFSPSLLFKGTERVVKFSKEFVDPPPFKFLLLNKNLTIEEGEDFNILLEMQGSVLPKKIYLLSKDGRFVLDRESKNKFKGVIKQVRGPVGFSFEASGYSSEKYFLEVLGKTALNRFDASLEYPRYLEKKETTIKNAKNLTIEEGTTVTWSVQTKNTSVTEVLINKKKVKHKKHTFEIKERFLSQSNCQVLLTNKQTNKTDTVSFVVDVVKDKYPTISVLEERDTLKEGVRYFSGSVSDDYGFSSLIFVYTVKRKNKENKTVKINVGQVSGIESKFNFAVDFRREELLLEDEVEYEFFVADNDGVNGPKKTKSKRFKYILPNLKELNKNRNKKQEETKEELKNILNQTKMFDEKIKQLRKEVQNNKKWNNENEINQLQQQQENIIKDLKSLKEEINTSLEEKTQLSEIDKNLLDQQALINKLLEDLMDDELKDLLKQIEELIKENQNQKIDEKIEKLEEGAKNTENQLDRTLEMLKRLQVNEKIDDLEKELKELAQKQEELKNETKNKKKISKEDKDNQGEINKAFEDLKKETQKLDSLNKSLESPLNLNNQDEQEKEITEDLKNSKDQLDKNKGEKAGGSQKAAAEKMKQMAEALAQMQSTSNKKQAEEDLEMLRNVLEGLVLLSLNQEELLTSFKRVSDSDPSFYRFSRLQRKSIDDSHIIRDSLLALSKRQPKVARFIDKELGQIKANQELILEDIDERKKTSLSNHQQYVMTSYNNLALLLNEALQDLQNQLQLPGTGSCNKPGGNGKANPSSGSPGDMKEMLKNQLEQMKKGSNPGGKSPGEAPGKEGGGNNPQGMGSKEVAKMAAQQNAMRKALEKIRNEMNKNGKGEGNKLNPLIKELKEQEKNLINKTGQKNIIDRQKKILTRLLESEKALIDRGLDEKRESKTGVNKKNSNQIEFKEYKKKKIKQMELLRSIDPSYQKYYKDKANEYLLQVL